ncbi:GAF domain-containing protein [Kiloniella sp.]|uniref:GAF domain-containing protein n=1 Tax=Kiloniella sp. TaxID=1938587 RepID=UPI003B013EF3
MLKVKGPNSKYSIRTDCEISDTIFSTWQETIDLLAKVTETPAALIMRAHAKEIEVFAASNNPENVYPKGAKEHLNSGLYCETVMSTEQQLVVPNALTDPLWDHNPDIKLGMISYCGLPIKWPKGEIFGTICILDSIGRDYSKDQIKLMQMFRNSIELSLATLSNANEESIKRQKAEQNLQSWQTALNEIILAMRGRVGKGFLDEIVCVLGRILGSKLVYIGLMSPDGKAVETQQIAVNGQLCNNRRYSIETSPCERVFSSRETVKTKHLSQPYLDEINLNIPNLQEYIGAPLMNSEGHVIGVLVILGKLDKATDSQFFENIIETLAARTTGELQRVKAFDKLQDSQQELTNLLEKTSALKTQAEEASEAKTQFLGLFSALLSRKRCRPPSNLLICMVSDNFT